MSPPRGLLICAATLRSLSLLPLHCSQFINGDVAVDNVIGRVCSCACRRRGLVANRSDFAGAALGEEAALKALAKAGHGAGESDASRHSVRVGYGRGRKECLRVRM